MLTDTGTLKRKADMFHLVSEKRTRDGKLHGVTINVDAHEEEGHGDAIDAFIPEWQLNLFRNALTAMAERKRMECATCGKRVDYLSGVDRYYHRDGTDNNACWLAATRGGVAAVETPRPRNRH